MNNQVKTLNLLGIAMGAGKLVTGEELTIKAIQNGQAKLVFVARDVSQNTEKKLKDKCSFYKVPLTMAFSQAEISQAIGRARSIVAVCDQGFVKSFKKLLSS